jgi:hypothetical protein
MVVDLFERLAYHHQRFGRRHAPAVHESDLDPSLCHLERDLRPGAVHDANLVPLIGQRERIGDRVAGDGAAELDHDSRHVVYSAFSRTYS